MPSKQIYLGSARKVGHTAGVFLARSFLIFLFACLICPARAAPGLPRPRVPRLLRLVDGAGHELRGDCFAPQFAARGDGLFFLRMQNGARTLWFASAPATTTERYPAWRATPIWQPRVPLQLSEIAVLPDANVSLTTTGAVSRDGNGALIKSGHRYAPLVASCATPGANVSLTPSDGNTAALATGTKSPGDNAALAATGASPGDNAALAATGATPGGDAAFLATGAQSGGAATQLWRVESGHEVKILWSGRERLSQPAISPDGTSVVFTRYVRDDRGHETPQLWRMNTNGPLPKPVLLFKNARRGFYLDARTVVFEQMTGTKTAFCAINPSARTAPRFLLRGSGEGARIGNGAGLLFAAGTPTTSLFLLARDGSGLHALVGTEGARHPAVSSDQTHFAFSAPDPRTRAVSLWLGALDTAQDDANAPVSLSLLRPQHERFVPCKIEPMPLPPIAPPTNISPPAPGATKVPVSTPTSRPTPISTTTPLPQPPDKADMDVAGTLATTNRGGKMRVVFWAKNRGQRAWTPDDVRVVVRWVLFDAGTRRRWEFKWMRGKIPPLGQTRFPIDVTIPAQSGRYKVIYSLIRLPSKGAKVIAPPYNAPQDDWPGEFAATAFAVNVN